MKHVARVALLLLLLFTARASAAPVRVAIECEGYGRTKACPSFLLGFVDANKVLLNVSRANADVVVFASAAQVALTDKVHLRFVGRIPKAPQVIEVDVDVDTRAADDGQRAQLEPAFLRGIALFVAALHPSAVTVALGAVQEDASAQRATSPWGTSLTLSGSANYTRQYQEYTGASLLEVTRIDPMKRLRIGANANGGISRQPPVQIVDDAGNVVGTASLDAQRWQVGAFIEGVRLIDQRWSIGAATSLGRDDPKGQFRGTWNARAGIAWDRYRADDPRGNRLELAYVAGYQADRYNLRNELGERRAHYPFHAALASASVRKDRIGVGATLRVQGEVLHPERRHHITVAPFIEWKLGGHVDLNLVFNATKRQLPGPDPSVIDPTDFAQLSRLAFAQPFSFEGFLALQVHTDRTNGARNDRLGEL